MQKQLLRGAHNQLFLRPADECFSSLDALADHCGRQRGKSLDRWHLPADIEAVARDGQLGLLAGGQQRETPLYLNDWSFGQLCRLAGVGKETVNRLSANTAAAVFQETLAKSGRKPWQLFTQEDTVRSIHGASYTRLFDAELVSLAREAAIGFEPPQPGCNGASGLYAGEQDLFLFLIDPTGWVEIGGEAFAPGLFLFNSEVGRRAVGIQTFWFQSVCQNHLVWDAVEVASLTRKHTTNVQDGLTEIRRLIDALCTRRDARRDGFARVMAQAMQTRLGHDADEVLKVLLREGIPPSAAKAALEIARREGRFTIFSLVDALTRLAGELRYVGDRTDADLRASRLLALAA